MSKPRVDAAVWPDQVEGAFGDALTEFKALKRPLDSKGVLSSDLPRVGHS